MTYKIETKHISRGGPDCTVLVRRSGSPMIVGVGCGATLGRALRAARAEVRMRRLAGEFRGQR